MEQIAIKLGGEVAICLRYPDYPRSRLVEDCKRDHYDIAYAIDILQPNATEETRQHLKEKGLALAEEAIGCLRANMDTLSELLLRQRRASSSDVSNTLAVNLPDDVHRRIIENSERVNRGIKDA